MDAMRLLRDWGNQSLIILSSLRGPISGLGPRSNRYCCHFTRWGWKLFISRWTSFFLYPILLNLFLIPTRFRLILNYFSPTLRLPPLEEARRRSRLGYCLWSHWKFLLGKIWWKLLPRTFFVNLSIL